MNVHIVLPPLENEERILPRKGRALAELTGWSMSSKPKPSADLNYFFPYLTHEVVETRAASYFTHREDHKRKPKADRWDEVARSVDLRLTSSRHNLPHLTPFGPTRIVVPPLDRQKFRLLSDPVRHSRPVVGISGYVYPGGRKGEKMLALLRDSKIGRQVTWQASGRGWPVPTRGYLWEDMQEFYQGLDVYVCTSLNEGVGYGPLEALACGIPVVIPQGVGMFDELGDQPGVCRYRANHLADLERALAEALSVEPDRERLRSVTEMFTAEQWAADHVAAFEGLLAPSPMLLPVEVPASAGPLPEWQTRSGLYVVAFGEPSRKCAVRCIESFKRCNPSIPAMLCSDRALGPEDLLAIRPDTDIGGRFAKLAIYDETPPDWQYILYLDADTETIAPLGVFFDWLQDGWELVICKNPQRFAMARFMVRPDNGAECDDVFAMYGTDEIMQWNGGVFAFRRCDRMREFFRIWNEEFAKIVKRDQPPLLRALFRHPLRLWALGNEWNLVPLYDDPSRSAGILHYPTEARRWTGIVDGRADSEHAWQKVQEWQHSQPAKSRKR